MSRASVTTFGRGVSFVASGETGTQANEFEAAIKSVTSSITVGAVFLYDTRSDSDGGAWRKKAKGSWYYETLNTATRGGRREFPSVALLVADNATGAGGITVYDADDPSLPMFMIFSRSGTAITSQTLCSTDDSIGSLYALNGRIYFGVASGNDYFGLRECDLTTDTYSVYNTLGKRISSSNDRNATVSWTSFAADSGKAIANNEVKDIAATIVEGSEIGALGLPIPTVAVGCGAKISVIHPNGSVYDLNAYGYAANKVAFDTDNSLLGLYATGAGRSVHRFLLGQLYSDTTAGNNEIVINLTNTSFSGSGMALGAGQDAFSFAGKNTFALGGTSGLQLWKRAVGFDALNTAEPPNLSAYITSTYNSGMMLGDIRFAGLANAASADRSVKGNTLNHNGSVSNADVATNAELQAYSGFSASNFLSRSYDADFDFGTGDFSVMFWAKFTSNDAGQCMLDRSASGTPRILIYNTGGNVLQFYIHDGSGGSSVNAGSFGDDNWHQVVCVKRGTSSISIFVDGVLKGETTSIVSGTLSSATAPLHIGVNNAQNDPLNGSLSLVRISATAPTPTQVADIYRAEAPLFRSGAKCLLSGADAIEDLSYDSSTDLLTTAGNQNNIFRGLERVDTFNGQTHSDWNSTSSHFVASNGGVSSYVRAYGTGGVLVDLPPFDVRGDTNIADTKLPDDGKLHFSGVTTDATPTVVGQIPISAGENYIVKANIIGCRYQSADSAHRIIVDLKGGFSRTMSGNVIAEPLMSKLSELEWSSSSMDVEFDVDTSANTIRIKVTGHSAVTAEWNAEVEVQRISEKTYER